MIFFNGTEGTSAPVTGNSITKYFPKIVSKEPADRTIIKEMLTELYGVRSAMMHHGRSLDFDIQRLVMLQESIRIFIVNMTDISAKHENKNSFLKEIDDAINAAY